MALIKPTLATETSLVSKNRFWLLCYCGTSTVRHIHETSDGFARLTDIISLSTSSSAERTSLSLWCCAQHMPPGGVALQRAQCPCHLYKAWPGDIRAVPKHPQWQSRVRATHLMHYPTESVSEFHWLSLSADRVVVIVQSKGGLLLHSLQGRAGCPSLGSNLTWSQLGRAYLNCSGVDHVQHDVAKRWLAVHRPAWAYINSIRVGKASDFHCSEPTVLEEKLDMRHPQLSRDNGKPGLVAHRIRKASLSGACLVFSVIPMCICPFEGSASQVQELQGFHRLAV